MQSFEELNLSAPLMRAVQEKGYQTPSPIQAQTLPILLGPTTDFVGLAATGTGKTAAFSIPLIEKIDASKRTTQALVLCPTRELALQVTEQINLLGKYKSVRALCIYGGASYNDQFHGLKRGASVVVGTPGRLIDHLERGTLKLQDVQTVVLDEADEMISMGFKEDIETILKGVNRETSSIWLFSATMSREVRKVADQYLRTPQQVQVNRAEMLPSTIEQLFYMTQESNKPEILCKLIDSVENFYGLVFCQTKSLVIDLTQYLVQKGYRVDALHGDKQQKARELTMQAFRDRKVNILICTDVASRGLDVKDITHVINYSLPRELDNYVHRIGRTARSGKTGVAMSLVTPSHRGLVSRIEAMTKSKMSEGKVPTRKEIGLKKLGKALPRFQEQSQFARAVDLLDDNWKTSIADMSREEIAGRFIALMFPEVFTEQTTRTQLGKPAPAEKASGRYEPKRPRSDFKKQKWQGRKPRFGGRDAYNRSTKTQRDSQ